MEKVRYMISDAAALAGVETHVLRYWEEELDLTSHETRWDIDTIHEKTYRNFKRSKNSKKKDTS